MLADFEGGYIHRREENEQACDGKSMVSNVETTLRGNTKKEKRSRNYIKEKRIRSIIILICVIATFIVTLCFELNVLCKKLNENEYQKLENAISYVVNELNEKDIISTVLDDNQTEITIKRGDVNVTLNSTEIIANMSGYPSGYVRATFNIKGELQYERISENGFRIAISIILSLLASGVIFAFLYVVEEFIEEHFCLLD